jgi:DNA-binding MarR family transcriptional regulator
MSTTPTFGPALVGQTESAFGAILDRELAGTGLTPPMWIALNVALAGGDSLDRDRLVQRVAVARNLGESEAQAYVDDLAYADLVRVPDHARAPVTVTEAGRRLRDRIGNAVGEVTQRLWGDLSEEDLATTSHVLSTIVERARQELSQT